MSRTLSLAPRTLFCHFHTSSGRKRQKAGQGLGISLQNTHALFHWLYCLYTYILSHRCRNWGEGGGTGGKCSHKFSVCTTPTLYVLYNKWILLKTVPPPPIRKYFLCLCKCCLADRYLVATDNMWMDCSTPNHMLEKYCDINQRCSDGHKGIHYIYRRYTSKRYGKYISCSS